jgi:hypothetical protein
MIDANIALGWRPRVLMVFLFDKFDRSRGILLTQKTTSTSNLTTNGMNLFSSV